MTITEALVELKLYDKKIEKASNELRAVGMTKKRTGKIGSMSIDEFEKEARSKYDSILQMISNRDAIKRAVVISNAVTKVKIGDKEMTVAEAIDRKAKWVEFTTRLINNLKYQLMDFEDAFKAKNAEVEAAAERMLNSYYGKDAAKKVSKEDYDSIVKPYMDANEYVFIDPIGIRKEIERLEKELNDFTSNVDIALSVSNATTFIEVTM